MPATKVSSKFQVVIPKAVREQVPIRKGQVLHVIAKGGVITLIPDRPLKTMRGFLGDVDARGLRDKEDRL